MHKMFRVSIIIQVLVCVSVKGETQHELMGSYVAQDEGNTISMQVDDTGHISSNLPFYVDGGAVPIVFQTRWHKLNPSDPYQADGVSKVSFYYPYFPNIQICSVQLTARATWESSLGYLDLILTGPKQVGISSSGNCYQTGYFQKPFEFKKS